MNTLTILKSLVFICLFSIFSLSHAATTTSLACYFYDAAAKKYSWQWGQDGTSITSAYTTINGDWFYGPTDGGPKTGFTRFKDSATDVNAEIIRLCEACANAKIYHKETGKLIAFFAADHGYSSNYPILLSTNILYGEY